MFDPVIRSVVSALVFMHCHDAIVREAWQVRELGTASCPLHLIGTYAAFTFYEESRESEGGTECRFVLGATADNTQNGTVRIAVDSWGAVGSADAYTTTASVDSSNLPMDPCNYNPLDGFNVYDFMLFLNEQPDWNGDGVYNSDDLNEFMGLCGS